MKNLFNEKGIKIFSLIMYVISSVAIAMVIFYKYNVEKWIVPIMLGLYIIYSVISCIQTIKGGGAKKFLFSSNMANMVFTTLVATIGIIITSKVKNLDICIIIISCIFILYMILNVIYLTITKKSEQEE